MLWVWSFTLCGSSFMGPWNGGYFVVDLVGYEMKTLETDIFLQGSSGGQPYLSEILRDG